MNTLTALVFACLAVFTAAKPSGHGLGVIVSGPSGVVTGHGPIGPAGHGLGGWDDGSYGGWDGGYGGYGGYGAYGLDDGPYSNVVHGNGATLVGATAGHAAVGHGGYGLGLGLGLGAGGLGAVGNHGHGGVVVKGPPTVPATIIGPGGTGAVSAAGLWGPTSAHGHGHGHW